ncbi:MAG: hypothetical protein EXR75_11410 [Myxococcales bacterium]|nr:hypothetical protein [Myxococcales bacterium]
MSRAASFAVALGLVVSLLGCNAGRAFIATPNDYAAYRRVRLAPDLDTRLAAAFEYLDEHPDGRYAERLQRFVARAEPVVFAARKRGLAGLEAYLNAMPHGPNADYARELLVQGRMDARRGDLATRSARETMLKSEAAGASRKVAAEVALGWARELVDPQVWASSFDRAPPKLLVRFRLSAPAPECARTADGQACDKLVVRRFIARTESGELERELSIAVRLTLDRDYRAERVDVSGVDLFVGTIEAETGVGIERGDEKAAASAMRVFSERLQHAVLADGRLCSGGESAAGVLTLACEDSGIVLVVERGRDGGADRMSFARRSR